MRLKFVSHSWVNSVNFVLLVGIVVLVCLRAKSKAVNNVQSYASLTTPDNQKNLNRMNGIKYFDFANQQLFPDSLIENFTHVLHDNLYGNPHSESPSSERSTSAIEDIRDMIYKYFDTNISQYTALFTYSDAHALKLIAESFPFTDNRKFYYSKRSHEKIIGLRRFAKSFELFEDEESDAPIAPTKIQETLPETLCLVMFPLVDSFDGHVMTKREINSVFERFGGNAIAADATLYLQTHKLSLREFPFHAITFSFEKLFGFPNIGCCLVSNPFIETLQKPYFGGGTLVYALTDEDYVKLRLPPTDRFEDGSLPFLSIVSIESGFEFMNRLGFEATVEKIESLKNMLIQELSDIRHTNGSPLVEIYGTEQSSIVTFNVLDPHANIVNYQLVVDRAAEQDIYIVGGCHSTPGTCLSSLRLEESDIASEGRKHNEIGAIRVSIGWSTTVLDIRSLIAFLTKQFVK